MIINEADVIKKIMSTEIDTQKYQITTDKKGMPTVQYISGNSKWFIHSKYDAVRDGVSFAENSYNSDSDLAVMGLGLGYHLIALSQMLKPCQKLHVFETNLSLLKIALENSDIMQSLQNDNVLLYAGETIEAVAKYFFDCLNNQKRISFIFYHSVLKTIPDDYRRIRQYMWLSKTRKNYTGRHMSLEDVKGNYHYSPNSKPKKFNIVILDCAPYHTVFKPFAQNLVLAFEYLGCNPVILSIEECTKALQTTEYIPLHSVLGSCDFFVTFHLSYTTSPLYDVLKAPILSIGLDRPYSIHDSALFMKSAVRNIIYTWSNKNDLRYSNIYYRHGAHHFLPQCAQFDYEDESVFSHNRFFDVVVLSGISYINNYEYKIPSSDTFDKETIKMLIKHYLEDCKNKTLEDYLQDALGSSLDSETIIKFIQDVGFFIDDRVRSYKKLETVKSLLKMGIGVHLFGKGWEKTEIKGHPLCIYHGGVTFDFFTEIFKYSKIFINIMPSYGMNAAHEKVFISMSGGALCITDDTEYFRDTFLENEEIVFYDAENPNELAEKVQYYLSHEDERLRITKNAFKNVRQNHTWINRAEDIISMYEEFMKQMYGII